MITYVFILNTQDPKIHAISLFPKPFSYLPAFFLSNQILDTFFIIYSELTYQTHSENCLKTHDPLLYFLFVYFQLLRQLLDDKILCKLQKPFEMKTVEGLSIISAMSMSEQASISSRQLSDRLLVSAICHQIL